MPNGSDGTTIVTPATTKIKSIVSNKNETDAITKTFHQVQKQAKSLIASLPTLTGNKKHTGNADVEIPLILA